MLIVNWFRIGAFIGEPMIVIVIVVVSVKITEYHFISSY